MNLMEDYIEQWQADGHIWGQESEGTNSQRLQADSLYPLVVAKLHQTGLLEECGCSRRIWDYCIGDFGSNPVDEIIDELV